VIDNPPSDSRMSPPSGGLDDLARPQATGTDADVRRSPVHLHVNTAQVRPLNAFGFDIRVAHVVGDATLLATDCAKGWHDFLRKGAKL
jgi:hypothetical protein